MRSSGYSLDNEKEGREALPDLLEQRANRLIFPLVALYYFILMPGYAVPGRWAEIASVFGWLDPFRPMMRPVWSLLTTLVSELPVRNLGLLFNFISALTGAAVCWLIFDIVRRVPFHRSFMTTRQALAERRSRVLAGIAAALFAAVSLPVITVSTRGDYAIFDLFLALLAVCPLMRFSPLKHTGPGLFYFSAAMAGLAMADYPGMVFVMPGLLLLWMLKLRKTPNLKLPVLIMAAALFAGGLSTIMIYGVMFADTTVAGFRDIASTGKVLKEFGLIYYSELRHSVPKIGWLLLIATNLVPFFIVMFRELDEPADKFTASGVNVLRIIFIVLGVMALLDLPGSPGKLIQSRVLLVAPYLLAAIWLGYLAGYYHYLFQQPGARRFRLPVPVIVVVLLGFAIIRNGVMSRPVLLEPVAQFADDVVKQLGERNYIVTAGVFDHSLRLAAHRANQPLALINLMRGNDPAHGRYHASLFVAPELQDMARLGVMPLMRDWFNRDPAIEHKLALLVPPEMLVPVGYAGIPDRLFYRLERTASGADPLSLYQQHQDYWSNLQGAAVEDEDEGAGNYLSVWLSRLANDLGVYLEEHDLPEEAGVAYDQALALWPDNFSATINQLSRARASGDQEARVAWSDRLDEMTERNRELLAARSIGQLSGRLHGPAAMLEEAVALGFSGRRDQAENRINRAAGLITDDDAGLQLSLARLYLQYNNLDASEEMFRRIIKQNPADEQAQLGLFRVAVYRGLYEEAAQRLDELATIGMDKDRLMLEKAGLEMTRGRYEEARRLLLDLADRSSPMLDAWYQLGLLAHATGDDELFTRASDVLVRQRNYMPGMLLLGDRAFRKADPVAARMYLEQAAKLEPGNIKVLERLLTIDYYERDAVALRKRSAAILAIDPDNPLGLYGAATLHTVAGDHDLAEIPLRRCLAIMDYGPARNDLAWILAARGDWEEAREHAVQAVALMPDDGNARDTLAMIQHQQGEVQAAADTIEPAVNSARGASLEIIMRATGIFVDAGRLEEARVLLARMEKTRPVMPPDQASEYDRLQTRLASSTP